MHLDSTWPLAQADFGSLFSHFPCIRTLTLELDTRHMGSHTSTASPLGRIDTLLSALRNGQGRPPPWLTQAGSGYPRIHSISTLRLRLRSSPCAPLAGRPVLRQLLRGLQALPCMALTQLQVSLDMLGQST